MRTLALLAEEHRVPRQDADHARKHLGPSSLAVISNQKVAALLQTVIPNSPEGCLNFWLQVLFCHLRSIGLFTNMTKESNY